MKKLIYFIFILSLSYSCGEYQKALNSDEVAVKFNLGTELYDAEKKYDLKTVNTPDPEKCQCGEVLQGFIKPYECKLFGKECTPHNPIGALMVSSEGSCAAYYNYKYPSQEILTS